MDTQVNKNLFHGARVTDLRQTLECMTLGGIGCPSRAASAGCRAKNPSLGSLEIRPYEGLIYH